MVKIVLVNPSTNAISERSLSAMRRIKTFLRSTESRTAKILHIHKEKTDKLSLVDVANGFVSTNDHRLEQLGKFSQNDL